MRHETAEKESLGTVQQIRVDTITGDERLRTSVRVAIEMHATNGIKTLAFMRDEQLAVLRALAAVRSLSHGSLLQPSAHSHSPICQLYSVNPGTPSSLSSDL